MGYCPFQSGPIFDSLGNLVIHHEPCPQSADCQLWDTNKGECSIKMSGDYITHIHDSHYHMSMHKCSEVPADCGRTSSVSNQATTLIGEFHGNEDLDDNGEIYGKDFKIADNSEKPSILESIEGSPNWIEPSKVITWSEYTSKSGG